MLAAVESSDVEMLAELMRQDPGFKVNLGQEGYVENHNLLHIACFESSVVIPLLLAHPDIDVNVRNIFGQTPFYWACRNGRAACVRKMLKDSRVRLNERNNPGETPLWCAAFWGHLDSIKWWIASGREMDLGKPGDVDKTDAIAAAKSEGKTEVVTLLERFKENPVETRHQVKVELGLVDALAAKMFALVVFVSDGLLQIKNLVVSTPPAARFFRIASQLPLELQTVLCYRVMDSSKDIISGKDSESAFKCLAKRI